MSQACPDSCDMPPSPLLRRARPLLGTLVEISARGASLHAVTTAVDQAFAVVEHIQALMSYHDPASDVSRLNRAGVACITVHPHTWFVLDTARSISAASHGIFDISVAPELVRHGFLPVHPDLAQPASEANWQHIALESNHHVRLRRPLNLDLGGIAKGYAVDCAIRVLQRAGLPSGQVNAGGDLRVFGDHAETIHVRHPQAATRLLPLCELKDGAIATSAPYYAGRQLGQQTIAPLIDTLARQACGGVRSVSVLADECIVADALTKVVYANPDQALAVLQHFGAHAVVLDADSAVPTRCRVRLSDPDCWRDVPPLDLEAVAT